MTSTHPLSPVVSLLTWGEKAASGRFFHVRLLEGTGGLKTIVYVDGYNLYYSALTKSPYKWLDIARLFADHIIRPVEPSTQITKIKFFTAPILGRMASDAKSPERQSHYHNALRASYPDLIEIITGYHSRLESTGVLVSPIPSAPEIEKVKIWKMEEKQTDVNIGLHMYRDAVRGECEQSVLCSNDSDLELAIRLLKEDFPHIKRGLIFPSPDPTRARAKSARLERHANWTRSYIRPEELACCQLPRHVINKKKSRKISCPDAWDRTS